MPECRLDDIMTVPRDYDSWSTTLVDWLLKVSREATSRRSLCPSAMEALPAPASSPRGDRRPRAPWPRAAARMEGRLRSTARTGATPHQVASFNGWVNVDGYDDAITYSQRPGHSEHQLGLTIDFMTLGGGSALQGDWATIPSGAWMAENAWKYGWLMSYPKGEGGALFSDATCFHYEPWHYRYLGREMARKVHRLRTDHPRVSMEALHSWLTR